MPASRFFFISKLFNFPSSTAVCAKNAQKDDKYFPSIKGKTSAIPPTADGAGGQAVKAADGATYRLVQAEVVQGPGGTGTRLYTDEVVQGRGGTRTRWYGEDVVQG